MVHGMVGMEGKKGKEKPEGFLRSCLFAAMGQKLAPLLENLWQPPFLGCSALTHLYIILRHS